MIILLSPTKTFTKTNILSNKAPMFDKLTNNLVEKFKLFSKNDFKTSFKISDNLANQTFNYYQDFNNKYQAITTYGGTAFKHLDPLTIMNINIDSIHILSALYGILRANDAISKYRFEMQSNIFGSMYDYWHQPVNDYLSSLNSNLIINLASKEYSKLLDFDKLNILTITFANESNGLLKSPSMMVKKQRGLMARALVLNEISNKEEINKLNINGYVFNDKYSKDDYFVFTKGEQL